MFTISEKNKGESKLISGASTEIALWVINNSALKLTLHLIWCETYALKLFPNPIIQNDNTRIFFLKEQMMKKEEKFR